MGADTTSTVNSSTGGHLKKGIRLYHATALVVGSIIGASIFVQPSEVTGSVPSLGGAILVWILAGVLSFFGALVAAELASTFPETGGVYCYLREAFSPLMGFMWGWAMFWTIHTGVLAAVAMVFARYLAYFIPIGDFGVKWAAFGAIAFLTWVNYLGVKHGSNLQAAFTVAKVVAIFLIIAAGFALGADGPGAPELVANAATATDAATTTAAAAAPEMEATARDAGFFGGASLQDFIIALVAGLFAFGGWHMVTFNAGETHSPRFTIPRALTFGVLTVTVCYALLNALYFYLLPVEVVIASDRVAADAADAVVGYGGAIMSGLVVFSAFGALSGIVLAGPRVYYAMARDGLLFGWFARLHPSRGTPHRALWLQAAWAFVLIMTGSYRVLFTRAIYTEWIFFGLMTVGLFMFRRRQGLTREYSIWGYPVVPAVFGIATVAIVLNQVIADPAESALGLGTVLLGVPVYLLWAKRGYARVTEVS